MQSNEHVVLECACSHPEHRLVVSWFPTDLDPEKEVYVSIHLSKVSFWKRLVYGVKYIFGRQCGYGAFQEAVLTDRNIGQLEQIINRLK